MRLKAHAAAFCCFAAFKIYGMKFYFYSLFVGSMWMETLLYPKEQTEVVQSRYMARWRMLKLVVSTCTVLIIQFCILAPMQLLAQWSFESLIFIQLKNNMK